MPTMRNLAAIVLLAVAQPVAAGVETWNTLLARAAAWERVIDGRARDAGDGFEAGLFIGYVTGVADYTEGTLHCMPRGVTVGQTGAMVIRFMRARPDLMHNDADVIVAATLGAAFPCERKRREGSGT